MPGKTALIVEEDVELRSLVCGLLQKQGFQTLVAEDDSDALRICGQIFSPIDLLIASFSHGSPSEWEFINRLRSLRPEMRSLIITPDVAGSDSRRGPRPSKEKKGAKESLEIYGPSVRLLLRKTLKDTLVIQAEEILSSRFLRIRKDRQLVLMLEEDDAYRSECAEVLEAGGYEVLATGDPLGLVALEDQYWGPIHLCIIPSTASNFIQSDLLPVRPEMRILVMSAGLSKVPEQDTSSSLSNVTILEKPILPAQLLEQVNSILLKRANPLPEQGKDSNGMQSISPQCMRVFCKETVLLVKENEAIRMTVSELLQKNGYPVFEARNLEEAFSANGIFKGPIHLLITDAKIDNKSGAEFVQYLRLFHPSLKVLYLGSYTKSELREWVMESNPQVLGVPFTREQVLRKVRTLLEPSQSS